MGATPKSVPTADERLADLTRRVEAIEKIMRAVSDLLPAPAPARPMLRRIK